jgi:hypothetical protein
MRGQITNDVDQVYINPAFSADFSTDFSTALSIYKQTHSACYITSSTAISSVIDDS